MIDWFRSWHGAPSDPKWRTVARRASCRPGDVAAVVWYLLDRASQAPERGSIAGYDAEIIADTLGYETVTVEAIIVTLRDKQFIDANDRITAWERFQPIREDDNAAERARAYRERKRAEANALKAQETPCERIVTPPSHTVTQAEREITTDKSREDKTQKESLATLDSPVGVEKTGAFRDGASTVKVSTGALLLSPEDFGAAPAPVDMPDIPEALKRYPQAFEELWNEYRVGIGEKNSSKARSYGYWKRLNEKDRVDCHMGLAEYCMWAADERKKRSDVKLKHLETFINGRNWEPYLERVE